MEFGRDATSQALSDEDIIKNLNTRLLAGEAPDVLFLDGLPIRSLMEKGVLASLDGVVSMDGYYENILTAYSLDGRPYAYPSVFRVPVFVSGSSEINVDDYASLAETVSRRAAEYEKYSEMAANGEPSSNYFGQKPDLLLMDGGRGQVSAAKEALAGTALADVPLYGMVKDDHHRTRAIVDSDGREIAINMNRGTFTFITAIQDETHRFANAYRKQQMKQKSYSSTLTEVPGVGPKTAKALLTQFKSVGAVKDATPDQLENTPGVGRQLAQTIYDYFHREA